MARKILAAALLSLGLVGCGNAPAISQFTAATLQAHSLSDTEKADLLSNIDEIAETFSEGTPSRQQTPSGNRGGVIYRSLQSSKILRTLGYGIASIAVKKHFSKPSVPDNVKPLDEVQSQALLATLQTGDVIECGNNGSFVHAIFYLGADRIVHALAQAGGGKAMQGVCEETLSGYLKRVERDKMVVLRPHWTPDKLAEATTFARAQVGKDYDTLFLMDNDDRFYCTELVYRILTKAGVASVSPHLTKQKWQLVTNEDLRNTADLDVIYRFNHE